MPERRRSLVRSTSIALLSGAVVLVGIVLAMVYLVYRTQDLVVSTVEARAVRSTAADLLLAVQDAETGQRGFLLTQDSAFLEPYIESIGKLEERERSLEKALLQSRFIAADPRLIKQTIASKLSELRTTLGLAQANRLSEAAEIARQEAGRDAMGDIRKLAGEMRAEENRLFVARTTSADASQSLSASIKLARAGGSAPASLLSLGAALTDANGAIFDVPNRFAGCIPGIHEVLRRGGLLDGIWCLDPDETLSPGQADEITRVMRSYPELI